MARYIRAKENAEQLNDSYMNLYYEMKKDQRISSEDRDEYRQKLKEIRDSAKGVSKYYEIACTYERKYEEDRSCFVPNCTWKFKQKEYFNYGMLTFSKSGVCYKAYEGIDEPTSLKP